RIRLHHPVMSQTIDCPLRLAVYDHCALALICPKRFFQMLFFTEKRLFRWKLDPQFPDKSVKRNDLIADQLAFLLRYRSGSFDKYFSIFFQQFLICCLLSWEYKDFHCSSQILQG